MPQTPEKFLRDWTLGRARFDIDASFHEHASDFHRKDSERFEMDVKALALRQAGSRERVSTLAADLLRLYVSEDADEPRRIRILRALGRIGAREGLPLLLEQARSSDVERCRAALGSLGFFGEHPCVETFSIYGGRIRSVVLPPAPDLRATQALLDALDSLRVSKPPVSPREGRGPGQGRTDELFFALRQALPSHHSLPVARKILELLRSPGRVRLFPSAIDDLGEVLARSVPDGAIDAIIEAAADESAPVRQAAAVALGLAARRETISVLLGLLGDPEEAVRDAANGALHRLAGQGGASETRSRSEWESLFGPAGERFDAERARRPPELEPGIYKLGP